MRKFIITSPAYTGEAELVYDESGKLVVIDLTGTDIRIEQVPKFKEVIPVHVNKLEETFASTKAVVVEKDYEVSFEMWWNKYDHKINRKRCEPLWDRMTKTEKVKALMAIDAYNKYLQRTGFRRKADPEKYLRDRYWETDWKKAA